MFTCLGLGMFLVFPLSFHSYSGITRYKELMMFLLTAVSLVAAGATCPRWLKSVRRDPVRLLGVVYFVFVLLSALFGRMHEVTNQQGQSAVWYGAVRYEGMLTQLCYLAIFLCFSLVLPHRRMLRAGTAAGLALFTGIVLLQYLGRNPLDLFPRGRSVQTNYEFQGTIGNIDMVSGYLCLAVPMLVLPYVLHGRERMVMACGVLGVLLECMMEVQSGLLGMAVLALFLVWMALSDAAARPRALLVLSLMSLCALARACVNLPWLDGGNLGFRWPDASGIMMGVLAAALGVLARVLPGKHVLTGKKGRPSASGTCPGSAHCAVCDTGPGRCRRPLGAPGNSARPCPGRVRILALGRVAADAGHERKKPAVRHRSGYVSVCLPGPGPGKRPSGAGNL